MSYGCRVFASTSSSRLMGWSWLLLARCTTTGLSRCTSWCRSSRALLLRVFELLVERAHTIDALFGFFFTFKFKAHGHFFEFIAFKCKLVCALRLSIEIPYHSVVLKNLFIIFSLLRYSIVERNNLCCRFS